MDDLDRKSFGSYMVSVGELYSREISAELIEMYWRLLDQFPIECVKLAFKRHATDPDCGQFFPKPADLIRHIQKIGDKIVKVNGMCNFCNQKGMLIESPRSPLNGQVLCFDHYIQKRYYPHMALNHETPKQLENLSETNPSKDRMSAYQRIREESKREAYEMLKQNFYTSND